MNDIIQVGDKVRANRDLPSKSIKKGRQGIVVGINNIDSEDYFDIKLTNDEDIPFDEYVYCSCENCWNKILEEDPEFKNVWKAPRDNVLFSIDEIQAKMISPNPDDAIPKLDMNMNQFYGSLKKGFKRVEISPMVAINSPLENKLDILNHKYRDTVGHDLFMLGVENYIGFRGYMDDEKNLTIDSYSLIAPPIVGEYPNSQNINIKDSVANILSLKHLPEPEPVQLTDTKEKQKVQLNSLLKKLMERLSPSKPLDK